MTQTEKKAIRTLTAQLLAIYEATSYIKDDAERYESFIKHLKQAFNKIFKNSDFKKLQHFSGTNIPCDTAYAITAKVDDNVKFAFTISLASFNDFLNLFGTLKQFVASGENKAFFLLEENTISTTKYDPHAPKDKDAEKKTRNYYQICQMPAPRDTPPKISDSEALYDTLILDGTISDTEDFSIVDNFFARPPERFSHFIRLALINFHIYHGGFELIHICRTCNNMFLPERSGDERGIFCTDKCRKAYHDRDNRLFNNCHQNQKNRIKTIQNFIEKNTGSKTTIDPPRQLYAATDCRTCIAIQEAISNNTTIKAGMCPILLSDENFQKLSKEYARIKNELKGNRKKSKKKTYGVEGYSIADDIKF